MTKTKSFENAELELKLRKEKENRKDWESIIMDERKKFKNRLRDLTDQFDNCKKALKASLDKQNEYQERIDNVLKRLERE